MATQAQRARWLELARGLLECPTAALMEEVPVRYLLDFAARRPALGMRRDRVGNVVLTYPARPPRGAPPLVLVAHLDHPSFWVTDVRGREVALRFRGWVGLAFARRGTRVRFFRRGQARSIGSGTLERPAGKHGRLQTAQARLRAGKAEAGGFAMWDFPGYALRGGKIVSRGCDDLLGAAAALCVLDELARARPKGTHVWGLFTRAEEVGFYGALAAVRDGGVPKDARVLSLECSRALPGAPQGAGAIVRVGDRSSLFDPRFTDALRRAAAEVSRREPGLRFQTRLMDGGSCEATVFCAAGLRASGLAVPLGNYHNQAGLDGGRKGIGPEHVAVGDFLAEVRLLLELAKRGRGLVALEGQAYARLKALAKQAEAEFKATPLLNDAARPGAVRAES